MVNDKKVTIPFLFVNPKAYFWGKQSLALAKAVDELCAKTGISIFFTCPHATLSLIAENTEHVIVTAQNMDSIKPGRGMGAVLAESLIEAGAKAVVLNHAENQKSLAELYACIKRAKEVGLITIVCADSTMESKAVAELGADIILAEPTELIGTGHTADVSYILDCCREIRKVNPSVLVMIASGITSAEDCYRVIVNGADGTGSTSGIVKAPDPVKRVEEMVMAILKAIQDRK